ncbi:MAG: Panacea domain-containing protein, partial [Alphaproteobacteria bacterium]|nr:Panacea domain-containing protein [Alphaproteobacteria bacterium]
MSFDAKKAAHMSAYLLFQAGGAMNHMKLIKLLYLAERENLRRCGWFMSDDFLVSMPHGPVLSNTLYLINRDIDNSETWNQLISEKINHTISLKRDIQLKDLDELSVSDVEILEDTWQKFGTKTQWELRDYTHDPKNCP